MVEMNDNFDPMREKVEQAEVVKPADRELDLLILIGGPFLNSK